MVAVYLRGAWIGAAPLRYSRGMKLALAFATVVLAVACGGSSKSAPPALGTSSSGKKLPFDPEQVRASVAATPGNSACSAEEGQTFGDVMSYQSSLLGDGGDPSRVDTSFTCTASGSGDGTYDCTWSVFAKPSGTPDPDDPCGGECCSGFQVMIPVAADGTFDASAINCIAPG